MGRIFGTRPEAAPESHRTTLFEIFFDLVFVFGLIRVTTFMSQRPAPMTLVQGFLVLLLLWISWLVYSWLGNHVQIDVGLIRAGVTVAMAAVFLAALVIPDAWETGPGTTEPRLILVLAYIALRVIDLALFRWVAAGNRQLSRTIRLYAISTALSWIPLVLGAVFGGTAQILLWAAALTIDMGGGVVSSVLSGWPVRSPGHFAERHSLVVIIALGESLISVAAGVGRSGSGTDPAGRAPHPGRHGVPVRAVLRERGDRPERADDGDRAPASPRGCRRLQRCPLPGARGDHLRGAGSRAGARRPGARGVARRLGLDADHRPVRRDRPVPRGSGDVPESRRPLRATETVRPCGRGAAVASGRPVPARPGRPRPAHRVRRRAAELRGVDQARCRR
ncbi:low temperature requirement protein A [Micromonospora sp. M12]